MSSNKDPLLTVASSLLPHKATADDGDVITSISCLGVELDSTIHHEKKVLSQRNELFQAAVNGLGVELHCIFNIHRALLLAKDNILKLPNEV